MSEVDKNKNNANAEDDNNAIVSLFAQCIVDDIADTAVDYGELGIDELADYLFNGNIEPSLLKLPIVKSVVAAGRLMFSIREGFLLKKALIFLKEFKKGVANPKEIEKNDNNRITNPATS